MSTASSTIAPTTLATSVTLLSALRDMRDHSSWQHFHTLYRPMLVAVAVRSGLSEQDANDVVQDAIVEVAKEMPTFQYDRTRGRFKGWLLTIVRRRIANFWRSKYYQHNGEQVPREQLVEPESLENGAELGSDFERVWDEEWLRHTLRVAEDHVKHEVEPMQFQAFQLHVVKGIAAGETARRLGIKLMEVYWAKYRVRRLMKKAISEADSI
jgi:RNA polymerase sigma-70 factor (ECF subfamily)